MSPLTTAFTSLTSNEKALFLARVAHEGTIFARFSYVPTPEHPDRNFGNPDAMILRDANNFVHRVVGYIMRALTNAEIEGQDESMIEMIEAYFEEWRAVHLLADWLKSAQ